MGQNNPYVFVRRKNNEGDVKKDINKYFDQFSENFNNKKTLDDAMV